MFKSLRLIITGWTAWLPAGMLGLMCFLLPSSLAHSECSSWISCGLNGLRGEAVFQQISEFEKQKSDELLRQFNGNDQDAIKRLTSYRQSVAQGSYRQTLRLCWAYRKAMGYEDPHGQSKLIENYNFEDSLKAWESIYAQGLYQSVDGITGLKADYLEVTGQGLFDFESWFKSMYAMNFVTSSGFLYGAAHCLNTVNSRQIQKFASAILVVDYEGSLTSQAALNWSLAKMVGLIATPLSRWVLHPLRTTFEGLITKLGKPRLVMTSVPVAVILGDNFLCHMARMEAASENLKNFMAKPTEDLREQRIQTVLLLAKAYRHVHKLCSSTLPPAQACQQANKVFYQRVQETGFANNIAIFIADRQRLRDNRPEPQDKTLSPELQRKLGSCDGYPKTTPMGKTDFGAAYADLLDVLIPVVQKNLKAI